MTISPPDASTVPPPAGRGRWGVVALLSAITALNLMDRQLPFIMAEPIRAEFHLTDTQLGLLGGIAFSLVYAFAALPLARLADRTVRTRVLAGCVTIWSLCTGLGAFAANFYQLAATRVGVALCEAGANPASHAIIADLFPDRRRALAIALCTAGVPIGVLLGMGLGGWLLASFTWRQVLMMATVPGLLFGLILMLGVREPPRIGRTEIAAPPMGQAIRVLAADRAFVWMCLACMAGTFGSAGGAAFGAAFLMRTHGMDIAGAGLAFGLMLGCSGAVGSIALGFLGGRLSRRDLRWLLWLPALGELIQWPLYTASWLVSDLHWAIALQALGWLAGSGRLALSYTAVQAVAHPHLRAFSSAMLQLLLNLFGNVLGPIAVGAISDHVGGGSGRGLGIALALCGTGLLLAAFAFYRAGASLNATLTSLQTGS